MNLMRRFTVLMLLLLLTSCGNGNNSPPYFSDETKNKSLESGINNEGTEFTCADFEEIYSFCKLFLKEFYNATTTNETMNLDPYLYNNNLKEYVLQKIKVGLTIHTNRIKNLIFGVKDIDWYLGEGYMFIELFTDIEQEVGGFGERHQFIIGNKDGRILISDWYSKSAGNVSHLDNIVREHTNKINNPGIWNDEEWVNNIFEAIDKI